LLAEFLLARQNRNPTKPRARTPSGTPTAAPIVGPRFEELAEELLKLLKEAVEDEAPVDAVTVTVTTAGFDELALDTSCSSWS